MNTTQDKKYRRSETRFSKSGRTVSVRLLIDRRYYEYARFWAQLHEQAYPAVTAEDELEGYLNMALSRDMQEMGWTAPPEIEALYPKPSNVTHDDTNDVIPF